MNIFPQDSRIEAIKKWSAVAKIPIDNMTLDQIYDVLNYYEPGFFFDHLNPNIKRRELSKLNILIINTIKSVPSIYKQKIYYNNIVEIPYVNIIETTIDNNNFCDNLKLLKRWFMGIKKFSGAQRIDIFLFSVSYSANIEEVDYIRGYLHHLKYLGIPSGVVVEQVINEARSITQNLPIRPLFFGKGVQKISNDFTDNDALRSILHHILSAEMGLGVDVTLTSYLIELEKLEKDETVEYYYNLEKKINYTKSLWSSFCNYFNYQSSQLSSEKSLSESEK